MSTQQQVMPIAETEISSRHWPAGQRWFLWKDRVRKFLPYSCDVIEAVDHLVTPRNFDADIKYYHDQQGGFLLSQSKFQPNVVQRGADHLNDEYQHLVLVCIRDAPVVAERGFRRRQLRPGDLLLLDMRQEFTIYLLGQGTAVNCHIPRRHLSRVGRGRRDLHMKVINGQAGPGMALRHYLLLLPLAMDARPGAWLDEKLRSVAELLNVCLTYKSTLTRPLNEQRLQSYLDYIGEHFSDPDFAVERMAFELGVSTSYIHRLFRQHETTVRQVLKRRRIDHAKTCLEQTQPGSRIAVSLTELATACGFRGLAQFSRAFREEVGVAPRSYRDIAAGLD